MTDLVSPLNVLILSKYVYTAHRTHTRTHTHTHTHTVNTHTHTHTHTVNTHTHTHTHIHIQLTHGQLTHSTYDFQFAICSCFNSRSIKLRDSLTYFTPLSQIIQNLSKINNPQYHLMQSAFLIIYYFSLFCLYNPPQHSKL
jgi:ABC-type Zn2+ transport system substrate-binding protein/surface adhesin